MSASTTIVRTLAAPFWLTTLLAIPAGCSSTGEALGFDSGYDPAAQTSGESPSDQSEPAGSGTPPHGADDDGGAGTGGADDNSDQPPTPDDQGIDNAPEGDEQCDVQSNVILYLSPDDSNSMSSPVQVRDAVLRGWGGIQSVAIRTWEFFNYYSFDYPAASEPGQVAIASSMVRDSVAPLTDFTLQIGISSASVTTEARAPINITLVLDTSGSMAGHPLQMLRETCFAIASSLKPGDVISMVTWNTENAIVLGGLSVDGPDDPILISKIEELEHGGGTDLHGGLVAGYDLAQQVYDPTRINRIVLVSDGGANAGITDIDLIAAHSGTNNEDGIYMVGVGVGEAATYRDDLMDTITDVGKGASVFVGDSTDAWSIFNDRFISTLGIAARDVQVRLDLPAGFEIVRTSAEEVSTNPAEIEPQHLAPNDSMVFHQQIRTCAPELVDHETSLTVTVRYLDAQTYEPKEIEYTVPFDELLSADTSMLLKGSAILAYAESLKAYKQSPQHERIEAITQALAAVQQAESVLPDDGDLAEIRDVLETLHDR